ncbi:hypothetical protein [Paracoccus lutimaris]|uniref:Uncharacterized protein n=1 Tax=Paracoccus lutimaris TaxID=1490030 RepID=A0A368Z5H2_9RHOB|nr:hypothetical protein [Paracoccus lutimaris]RCW86716.1 hypothetical protein DFP89_104103 [Paracoccus lutimaris]
MRNFIAGALALHMVLAAGAALAAPKGCSLPAANQRGKLPGGETVQIATLPDQQFLAMMIVDNGSISVWPPLPKGGIQGKDLCGGTTVIAKNPELFLSTLRVDPSVDLSKSYPAAFKSAAKRDQIIVARAGKYAVFPVSGKDDAHTTLNKHWDGKVMDGGAPAFQVGDQLYVRLTIK